MYTIVNSVLGLAFLIVGTAATLLMYRLWRYPFDHDTLKSAAPPRLMRLHRVLGYVYIAIYVYLMTQMVPRLWRYQVEFPARTVAHLLIGMAIGATLAVKIVVVRYFKHLEGTLAPFLGTGLWVMTVLLLGLSVPFAVREATLARAAPGGAATSPENLQRVAGLLPTAGLPAEAPLGELGSAGGLARGRGVLLQKCTQCHDLRTVLARPRTPEDWASTVRRMGDRSTVLAPIPRDDQWYATAYLIAVSPDLQQTVEQKRDRDMAHAESQAAAGRLAVPPPTALPATGPATGPSAPPPAGPAGGVGFDLAASRQVFESRCAECHKLTKVTKNPPLTDAEVASLVRRMVDNGLDAPENDLRKIAFYLRTTYVK